MSAFRFPHPVGSEFHQQVLESIDIDVVVFDLECRYQFVNESAIRNPEVRAWIIGKTDVEYCLHRGKDRAIGERRMATQQKVIETGIALSFEEELVGRDSKPVYMVRRICPIREEGRVIGLIGYGFDITELRRDQMALREGNQKYAAALRAVEESEARFRLVSRATNDVVWDWSLPDDRVWWNDAVESVFGHSKAAMGGSVDGWIQCLHEDDRNRILGEIEMAIGTGEQSWQSEYRFRRADGTYASVFDRGYIIRDERQRAIRMIGAMQDQTERHALEAQLRQAQKMEAVGQLAAGVAHDFNNIMTAVSAYAELIMQELPSDSPIRADAAEIHHAGLRARELTHQLLAFSRKQVVRPEVLSSNDLLRGTENLLRRSLGGRTTLTLRLSPDPCRVLVDRGHFIQIVMNLVLNARDAMRDQGGEVVIETSVRHRDELLQHGADLPVAAAGREHTASTYVELVVRDNGVGMDAETRRRMFEPFFTTKPMGEGSGLGLATVYGITTQANGFVWAESELGKGTTFRVLLPLTSSASPPAAEERRASTESRSGTLILVVEDEQAVRMSVVRMLRHRGYDVVEAPNAAGAIDLWRARARDIDAMVSDVVMPGMRGPELATRLRDDRPDLPVVFISGYTADALTATELSSAYSISLRKPFTFEELDDALQTVLRRPKVPAGV